MDIEGSAFGPSATGDEGYDAHELAELADELVDQIAAARQHYAELRATIDGAPAALRPAVAVYEHDGELEPLEEQQGYHRTPEEEAEIVALGMALNGGSRDEAHMHIVETFGIYDTDEILDRTFGAATHARVAAPRRRRRFARSWRG